VLGVAGGLVSAAFTKLLLGMRARFLRFPQSTVWFQPVAGGLLVGLMGWFVPQVLGVGYGFVGDALNGRMAFNLMVLLVVLKLIAVTTSYASGNAGGIFGPALFIGAMLGVRWDRGASFLSGVHRDARSIRTGRDGRGVRGGCARSHDFGADDLRDDAGLCRDRPADDCESGESPSLLHDCSMSPSTKRWPCRMVYTCRRRRRANDLVSAG